MTVTTTTEPQLTMPSSSSMRAWDRLAQPSLFHDPNTLMWIALTSKNPAKRKRALRRAHERIKAQS